jgi:energy-coupling factor transport system permease protein
MRLFTPLRPNPAAVLARANPVAKLVAAAILMAVLFLSADPLTPALVLAGLAVAIALSGLAPGALWARSWPLLVAAASVGFLNVVFAPAAPSGLDLVGGLALGLRLLGIALAGLLAMVTTDPTRLADSLHQQWRLSSRVAVGALAAARLLPIMAVEWQTLALARRARGVSSGGSPVAAAQIGFGMLLALLVGAIRRGTRLATAMEARGFGALPGRSIARPERMRGADWRLIAAAAALAFGALGASLVTGSWRFIFG